MKDLEGHRVEEALIGLQAIEGAIDVYSLDMIGAVGSWKDGPMGVGEELVMEAMSKEVHCFKKRGI